MNLVIMDDTGFLGGKAPVGKCEQRRDFNLKAIIYKLKILVLIGYNLISNLNIITLILC